MAEVNPNDINLTEEDFETLYSEDAETGEIPSVGVSVEKPQPEEASLSAVPEEDEAPVQNTQKILGQLLAEDEDEDGNGAAGEERKLKELWQAMDLSPMWILRTIGPLLAIAAVFAASVITLGYQANNLRIEHKQLKEDLQKWHDLSLTRKSELSEKMRQSRIEQLLRQKGDSTLAPSTESVYSITLEH